MFRTMFSPIIRSTWLYLQYLVLFTKVAAGRCHGWVETAVSTHPWHQPAATWVNTTRYCKYNQVLLMMGENIARNMYSRIGMSWNCSFNSFETPARQQLGWTLLDTVNTVKCSWWCAKTSPETCRTDLEYVETAVSTHSRHQPAATWVSTTRYCKYSQVLLMMGENIARNMYSRLGMSWNCSFNSFETPAGSNLGEHYQIL